MEAKILIFKFFLIIFIFFFFFNGKQNQKSILGKARIIDGDTVHINKNKIRLHGIDAPELKQTCNIKDNEWNCGHQSMLALKKLILNNKVSCKIIDIDKYKRLIGICFVKNININKYMVKNGWAIAYRYYSNKYVNEEELAKKNRVGIWQGQFIDPYLYRKNNN